MNADSVDADFETLQRIILDRKTKKVLRDPQSPVEFDSKTIPAIRDQIREAIEVAGWAPFHYDRAKDGIAEPWRSHLLWHEDCRFVAQNFFEWFTDVKPGNKLPAMLSACGCLILITWLPQFQADSSSDVSKEKQRDIDEEHLAATAAMIQNLLLLLTARGLGTYWSSGGQFRSHAMFEKLGIELDERLLAAIFVEFPESQCLELERIPGKLRENRSTQWCREITLDRQSS